MFARFQRSWALGKQSLSVLRGDKQLVIFPLLSGIACLLVLASFALPIAFSVDWSRFTQEHADAAQVTQNPVSYVVMFAFYFTNFFVITFFNAALIACVVRRYNGEEATIRVGLKAAASRLPQILGWAFVAATVGMVLRAIEERVGFVGRIVVGLLGFAWAIATYFVVPVLVVEGVGPIDAVKRSAGVMRKAWGETLVIHVGLGAISFVGLLLSIVPLAAGVIMTIMAESIWPVAVGGALTLLLFITLALVTSTLQMILVAALYRFAATGLVPEQFDARLLQQMIRSKN